MEKKAQILVADDDILSQRLMKDMLTPLGYQVTTAQNGKIALEKAKEVLPDLIFLDIVMPELDGYETCQRLKNDSLTQNIPVVLITALENREAKIKGLAAGANDFLAKPVDSTEITLRAQNLLRVKEFEDFLKQHNKFLDAQVRERTAQLSEAVHDLNMSRDLLKESYLDTIFKLTAVAEYKDGFTASHIKRVGHYCRLVARELGWSEEEQETIFYASPMHDIGKVSLPSDILLKPRGLSAEEFALAKTHTTNGAKILHGSTSRFLKMAEKIALTHHERWDGTGFPRGLKTEEIPKEGMIMNLADQYDALRSERPYKPPFDSEKVYKIITMGDGRTMPTHFDQQVLEIFKKTYQSFNEIYEQFKD
jgi:putative two-component system response regulator